MDVQAWSHQSLYFADKLRAAVALETFRVTGNTEQQKLAVSLLEQAKAHWKSLVAVTQPHHQLIPVLQNGRDMFSWAGLKDQVERDLQVAKDYNPTSKGK